MTTATLPSRARFLTLTALLAAATLITSAPAHADVTPVSAAQCAQMKARHVITAANPVPCKRLATVSFDFTDADGTTRQGSVVVLDAVAPQVDSLFGELLLRSVPLVQARPMEYFNGDDRASMAANNTSAFNGRPMTGGSAWSKHAYGAAIDINPLQNPYVDHAGSERQEVLPPAGDAYLQRTPQKPGMAEELVGVFYDHGFLVWGGNWKQPIDYQHFEIGSRDFIRELVSLDKREATKRFEAYVTRYRECVHKGQPATAQADADDDAPEDIALRDSCAARVRR